MTLNSKEATLAEIDSTIDQLINIAKTLKQIEDKKSYALEIAALKKTKESLFAHLIYLQNYLEKKENNVPFPFEKPMKKFSKIADFPKIHKRRKTFIKQRSEKTFF